MNAKEVVRALRCCSNVDTRKPDCDNCPLFGERLCVKKMLEGGAELIESLQARLKESQRRADAAVEDMKLIVDAVREAHCDETCCFACKFDCDTSITDSGCHANECPGFERDDCFEWRGPAAGEGERV